MGLYWPPPILCSLWELPVWWAVSVLIYITGRSESRYLIWFPSVFSIFIARHFVVPVLPEQMLGLQQRKFFMLAFAILMPGQFHFIWCAPAKEDEVPDLQNQTWTASLILPGLVVGFITGLLPVAVLLIIPAPVFILHLLLMRKAIGTSLLIISINSIFGFYSAWNNTSSTGPSWSALVLAIAGAVVGNHPQQQNQNEQPRKIFGWFVLIMAIYILVKELHLFWDSATFNLWLKS